jgi:predicted aspartyl protease
VAIGLLLARSALAADPHSCPSGPAPPALTSSVVHTAVIDDCLTVEGPQMTARLLDSGMSIGVQVNGNGPFQFLVDSGADRSVIGAALAKRLSLPAGETVRLNDVVGATDVGTFRVDALKVGDSSMFGISAPAFPEQSLGAQGILGVDALADRRIMLDFESGKVTLEDATTPEKIAPGEIVVIGHRRHGQLILTEVRVEGLPIYALIDTGSDVTIGNIALLEKVAGSRHPPEQLSVVLTSVTGRSMPATAVLMKRIEVGGLRIRNLRVAFADVAPFAVFGLADRPAMLLGTDALKGLKRMSLDFHQYRVRFQLRDRD